MEQTKMGSDNVAEHTKHFMDVSKRIRELEGKNTGKRLQQKKEQLADLSKTVQDLETMYKKATEEVAKEKADVDKMKEPSTRDFFQDQATFDKQMSIEQEEYLEAVSNQEMIKKQLDGVSAQKKQVEQDVAESGKEMESLLSLYDEQDEILAKIFNGAYGSDLENKLEAEFDALLEREQRIQVARYKWSNAKVLLQHAVKQMGTACNKWMEVEKVPKNMQAKYMLATETRNNLVAASQNISSAHRYLNQIKFPYCEPGEVETLNRATTNVYIDMQHPDRHKHAYSCYHITFRRASALLQWFDNVINKTINKDLQNARQELKTVEKRLREERLKLIKEKLGSEADGLTLDDMGGEDDFDDNEPDAELMQVCQAEAADGSNNMLSVDDGSVKAATPLPLNELAPLPSQDELFGNIEQLKQQHEKEMAEFDKAQETNKVRMEQGLQEKLAARRNRRARRFQE